MIRDDGGNRRLANGVQGSMKNLGIALVVTAGSVVSGCGTSIGPSAPESTTTASPAMTAAHADAMRILSRVALPPGSRVVGHLSGSQFAGGFDVPACNPQTDDVHFWSVPGTADDVVAFVRTHPTLGTEDSEAYGPTSSNVPRATVIMENTGLPQTEQETLDVTVGQVVPGQVGLRVDAYVAPPSSECARSSSAGR